MAGPGATKRPSSVVTIAQIPSPTDPDHLHQVGCGAQDWSDRTALIEPMAGPPGSPNSSASPSERGWPVDCGGRGGGFETRRRRLSSVRTAANVAQSFSVNRAWTRLRHTATSGACPTDISRARRSAPASALR
jgi:hypothetical protein